MTLAATEDSSRSFLMTKQILKPTQNCDACNSPMVLSPCAASKSADLYIWKCGPVKLRFKYAFPYDASG